MSEELETRILLTKSGIFKNCRIIEEELGTEAYSIIVFANSYFTRF